MAARDKPLSLSISPFTRALDTRVRRYVERFAVLRPGERLLVGVSGGQDSLALLLLLSRLAPALALELTAAHFDHRLRSRREARGDESLVRRVAGALAVEVVTGAGDVRGRAGRRREGIEEAARHLRFAFLGREARRLGATAVVLGHTRDDLAETTLLHLLRGSGLDGLVGLRPRCPWPFARRGPALARPLLAVTRDETLRYCRESGIEPREDPTNLELNATRNRLRHELLPALRRFNPRLDEALSRLGRAVGDAIDWLDAASDEVWGETATLEAGAVRFRRRAFQAAQPALRARLLRRAVRHIAGTDADIEFAHLDAVETALGKRRASVSLSHGLRAFVGADEVRIAMRPPQRTAIPETALTVPGRTELPGWTVTTKVISPPPGEPRSRSRLEAWLDADTLGPDVRVRSRRPGDRLRPLGLGGEKKVQDLLVDGKAPEEERDAVPIVCGPWGVAWVVGHRMDERAALREGSRRALRLRFRRSRID